MRLFFIACFLLITCFSQAQHSQIPDTTARKPLKLEHAEPLYIDLIRDLGAHKGEKEWNIGAGMTDNLAYDRYELLVEYEWAPIDRLGLEIEVPVTVFTQNSRDRNPEVHRPSDRIEALKLAAQYTFLVSEKLNTSLAVGNITEFEFTDIDRFGKEDLFQGVLFNPFFVAAKRWGQDFHTLVYTGPRITKHFGHTGVTAGHELHTSFYYMIPHSRNFVGVELNKVFENGRYEMTIRPQMRLVIHEGLMVGIVTGVPVSRENERLSSFVRLIYEPGSRKKHHKF
jgi:hypothetical protein